MSDKLKPLSFQQKYNHVWPVYAPGGGTTRGSLEEYAAQTIDSSWHYSWYWPKTDWIKAAIKDARTEAAYASKRLTELQDIIQTLKRAEVPDDQ